MPSTENGRRSRMARRRAPSEHRPRCCCHQWSMSAAQSARRLSHGSTSLCSLSWSPHGESCLCHLPVSPPMAWLTRGEEGAGGHMVKAPGLLKQKFQGQVIGHTSSWCQRTSCGFRSGSTSLLAFLWLCACGVYAAFIRIPPQSCKWPCGLMDKALVFGTKDCRFESCQGHPAQPALRLKRRFCPSTEAALR